MSIVVIDRIKEFVQNMDLSSEVLEISNDGTNTTLKVGNVFHIRAFAAPLRRSVFIDGSSYDVVSVNTLDDEVEVAGVITEATTYKVPNPFFFHGTLISTANEINCLDPNQKTPMIYLNEIIDGERPINSDLAYIGRVRLAFADYYSNDYTREQHYEIVIRPLQKLVDYVFSRWEGEGCLSFIDNPKDKTVPKWGTITNKGTSKKIFNMYLDAIEWDAPRMRFCKC